jgi:inhibitor of the pro-sigma K processing machinery
MDLLSLILLAAIVAIILILFSDFFRSLMSKLFLFVLNGLGGLILFLLLVYVLGVNIPVTIYTIVIVLIFGLPGLACLLILHYGGMI